MPRHFIGLRVRAKAHSPARLARTVLALATVTAATACGDAPTTPTHPQAQVQAGYRLEGHRAVLDVVAEDHRFHAPAQIPSGWTTLRLHNRSDEVHFILIAKLPEGATYEEDVDQVVPTFQAMMDLIIQKGATPLEAFLANIVGFPGWFLDPGFTFFGGPGLTAAGRTSSVVVDLAPGTYVLECDVKEPDGKFHSYLGMIAKLVVTPEPNGASAPEPTMVVTLRSDGIHAAAEVRPGRQIIAVDVAEQQAHGNFLGNDVHLARLADDTDLGALSAWMNWAAPMGLVPPAPAEFMGGMQDLPAGSRGYIDVVLTPGLYAWVAEVDDPLGKGMLQTFRVPFGRATGR